MPSGRRSGGEVVSQAFIDAITDAGHDVTVVGWIPHGFTLQDRPGPERIVPAGTRHIETATAPRADKAAWLASAFARRLPYSAAKYRSRSYLQAAAGSADVTLVDHAQVGWAAPASGRVIYVAHNAEHALYGEASAGRSGLAARVLRREARLIGRIERDLVDCADSVWALTADDAGALRDLGANDVTVFAVPGRAPGRTDAVEREGVRLIGNWTWGPNASGLRWFASEVAPLLPEATPVVVAGAGADWLETDPRIRYEGRVADADAFLAGARVVAVPSLAGSGVQVRTLDAIAAGAWLVATPTALRGIADPPPSVAVAQDPAGFARELERLTTATESERPSDESLAWSARRGEAFAAQVRNAIG